MHEETKQRQSFNDLEQDKNTVMFYPVREAIWF